MYNVHRNPRGAFTPILDLFLEVPPRVFLGILSEYLAQKYSPELVNKDFGDFLVMLYVIGGHRGVAPAYAVELSLFFCTNIVKSIYLCLEFPEISLSFFWVNTWESFR